MLNPDWTYESRIEKVTDQEWIDQHGWQTQVDLIGTIFEDLPKEWKQENLEAAKFVIGQIKEKIENWEDITDPQIIEKIAEEIHNKWLERNWIEWSFEDQRVAYNQLTEEEKAKDRNQVLRAIEIMKEYSILENETNQEIEGSTETTTQNEENDEVVEQIEPTSTEQINEYTIQEGLTEEEKENIEELKKLWIIFDDGNEDIKWLTKQDVKNIAELQKLWFDNEDIVIWIKEIKWLTEQDIQNIPELQKLGFYNIIIISRIENIKWLTKQDIQNIPELQKLGFEIRITKLQEIKWLTKQDIQNIPELQKLGFTITIDNIGNIKWLTKQDIIIISELQKVWFDIDENMLQNINWLKENNKLNNENIQVFKKLSKIRDISDIKGIVTIYKNLSEQDIENIKKLSEQDIENIKELQELEIVKDIKELSILRWITLTNEEKQLIAKIIQKWYNIDANALITIINNIDIIETENIDYKKYNHSKEEIKVHQKCITGIIVETIQQYVENAIQEEKDITTLEIIDKIRPLLLSINDKETKAIILWKIWEIVKKFNTVRKYLDFENWPYKTPKELLCAMRWIDDSKIKDVTEDITVIQHWVWLTFFVWDQNSFDIILDEWTGNEGVAWFYSQRSDIDELRCTLSVVNGSISEQIINVWKWKATTDELIAIKKRLSWEDPYQKDWVEDRRTILHEWQHNWNSYFMPDKHSGLAISRAKDEIIANLREWSKIEYIKEVLTWGSYQYWLEWRARTRHKLKVKELLTYVNDLIELTKNPETWLTREKVISMLADTPTNERKKLHTCIWKAVKLHNQKNVSKSKIEKLKNAFIIQIKERAWNHKLIKNLIEFWNPLFPGYIIKLEAFRRSWTAKKENVINNLENCNSIEEIKYILNDPQYSHIWRWPNNLWGIEISNIIDEVIAWKLTIDYIPIEIRQHVQNLIK